MQSKRAQRGAGFAALGVKSLMLSACSALASGLADGVAKPDALFRAGEFDAALSAYEKRVEANAKDGPAQLRIGEIALLSNRFADAALALERARALGQRKAAALLAEMHYRQNRFEEAADFFEEAGARKDARKLRALAGKTPNRITTESACSVVSFERTDPLPVIKARINDGEEAYFLLDTGASEIILDDDFAKAHGVERFGAQQGVFAGGKKAALGNGVIASFAAGNLRVENAPVHILDTSAFAAVADGLPISGFIGTTLLYQFSSVIDYPNDRLLLGRNPDACGAMLGEEVASIRFWLAGEHLILARGAVNEAPPMMFLVDTGLAGYAFTAPKATLDAAGVDLSGPSFEGVGGAGKVKVTPFMIDRLRLGDFEQENLPGSYGAFPKGLDKSIGVRIGGLISHAFFRTHAIAFDFESMTLSIHAPQVE